jgi:hypothetical protein
MSHCDRCDELVVEQHCSHGRDLCEGCLHWCDDCQQDFADSLAYDSDRDEGL